MEVASTLFLAMNSVKHCSSCKINNIVANQQIDTANWHDRGGGCGFFVVMVNTEKVVLVSTQSFWYLPLHHKKITRITLKKLVLAFNKKKKLLAFAAKTRFLLWGPMFPSSIVFIVSIVLDNRGYAASLIPPHFADPRL